MLGSPVESPSNRTLVRPYVIFTYGFNAWKNKKHTLISLNTEAWCSATQPLLKEWINGSEKPHNLSYKGKIDESFAMAHTTHIFKNHIIGNNSYVFMQCSLLLEHFYYHICLNDTMVTKVNKIIRHSLERPAEKTRSGTLWVANISSSHLWPSLHHVTSHATLYIYC